VDTVGDDQLLDHLGVVDGQAPGDHAADVLALDVRLLVAEGVDQLVDVLGHVLLVVPGLGLARVTHAADVDRYDAEVLGELGHHPVVVVPGARIAGHENERLPLPADDVVQLSAVDIGVRVLETLGGLGHVRFFRSD
jgi:hypothetical protein